MLIGRSHERTVGFLKKTKRSARYRRNKLCESTSVSVLASCRSLCLSRRLTDFLEQLAASSFVLIGQLLSNRDCRKFRCIVIRL